MRPRAQVVFTLSLSFLAGCDPSHPLEVSHPAVPPEVVARAPVQGVGAQLVTLISLPALPGGPSEALAVNTAGTTIVGYGWERARGQSTLRAVK